MADKIKMGAGGVPYKVTDKPKDDVFSEVLIENPNKEIKKEKKEKKVKTDGISLPFSFVFSTFLMSTLAWA